MAHLYNPYATDQQSSAQARYGHSSAQAQSDPQMTSHPYPGSSYRSAPSVLSPHIPSLLDLPLPTFTAEQSRPAKEEEPKRSADLYSSRAREESLHLPRSYAMTPPSQGQRQAVAESSDRSLDWPPTYKSTNEDDASKYYTSATSSIFSGGGGSRTSAVSSIFPGGGESRTSAVSSIFPGGGGSRTSAVSSIFPGGGESRTSAVSSIFHGGGESRTSAMSSIFPGGGESRTSAVSSIFPGGGESRTSAMSSIFPGGGESRTSAVSSIFPGGGESRTSAVSSIFPGGGESRTSAVSSIFPGGGESRTSAVSSSFPGGGESRTSAVSSSFPGGGGSRFTTIGERKPHEQSIPGLGEYEFPVRETASTQPEFSRPKYTPESARNILLHFGLEKDDLEQLISYPEDQITPQNLPFILRQIRQQKTKNPVNAVKVAPHAEPKPTTSVSDTDFGGRMREVPHQDYRPRGILKTSKVIDYGHISQFSAGPGEEVAMTSGAHSVGSSTLLMDSSGREAKGMNISSLISSCDQESSVPGLDPSFSFTLSSASLSTSNPPKQFPPPPKQVPQTASVPFTIPKTDTDSRVLPGVSKSFSLKGPEPSQLKSSKPCSSDTTSPSVAPGRRGIVLYDSFNDPGRPLKQVPKVPEQKQKNQQHQQPVKQEGKKKQPAAQRNPTPQVDTGSSVPAPAQMYDYVATTPGMFPHSCSLCHTECLNVKEWMNHQNTKLHLENCKLLRTRFPEWDGGLVTSLSASDVDARSSTTRPSQSHKKRRNGSSSSRSRSYSPQRHRGSGSRTDQERSRYRIRSRSRSNSPRHSSRRTHRSRSRSQSPLHRSTASRYRSRSRSYERRSSPRRRDDRRSSGKRSRSKERRSSEKSSARQLPSGSAEALAQKLLGSSAIQTLSNQSDLEAVVKTLAPALLAELTKMKTSPSSSSSSRVSKKDPKTKTGSVSADDAASTVRLEGVLNSLTHYLLEETARLFGKPTSVVIYRKLKEAKVFFEKPEDAEKMRNAKSHQLMGMRVKSSGRASSGSKTPAQEQKKAPPTKTGKSRMSSSLSKGKNVMAKPVKVPESGKEKRAAGSTTPYSLSKAQNVTTKPVKVPESGKEKRAAGSTTPYSLSKAQNVTTKPVKVPDSGKPKQAAGSTTPSSHSKAQNVTAKPVKVPDSGKPKQAAGSTTPSSLSKARNVTTKPVKVPDSEKPKQAAGSTTPSSLSKAQNVTTKPVKVPDSEKPKQAAGSTTPSSLSKAQNVTTKPVKVPDSEKQIQVADSTTQSSAVKSAAAKNPAGQEMKPTGLNKQSQQPQGATSGPKAPAADEKGSTSSEKKDEQKDKEAAVIVGEHPDKTEKPTGSTVVEVLVKQESQEELSEKDDDGKRKIGVLPLTGELLGKKLLMKRMACVDMKSVFSPGFIYSNKCVLQITNLPKYEGGVYTERDVVNLLTPFGFQHKDEHLHNIYVIPQKRMALAVLPTAEMASNVIRASVMNCFKLSGCKLMVKILEDNFRSPMEFYRILMTWMNETTKENHAKRIVFINNISPNEAKTLTDVLKKIDNVKNYVPLLNKVFVEFYAIHDADRLGVWYSLLNKPPQHSVYRLGTPRSTGSSPLPKMAEKALPDLSLRVGSTNVPMNSGIPLECGPPFYVTMTTFPFIFPTVCPWFNIPPCHNPSTVTSTIMMTGLPEDGYCQRDVTQMVWSLLHPHNNISLFYRVMVLPLQRRAFIFFNTVQACREFFRRHRTKPYCVNDKPVNICYVDHMELEFEEEAMYRQLMELSNAGASLQRRLTRNLLVVQVSEVSLDLIQAVMKEVASVGRLAGFLPLGNRICIEMLEPRDRLKVMKAELGSLTPHIWKKVTRVDTTQSLHQYLCSHMNNSTIYLDDYPCWAALDQTAQDYNTSSSSPTKPAAANSGSAPETSKDVEMVEQESSGAVNADSDAANSDDITRTKKLPDGHTPSKKRPVVLTLSKHQHVFPTPTKACPVGPASFEKCPEGQKLTKECPEGPTQSEKLLKGVNESVEHPEGLSAGLEPSKKCPDDQTPSEKCIEVPTTSEEHLEGPNPTEEHPEGSTTSKECSESPTLFKERLEGLEPTEEHPQGSTPSKGCSESQTPFKECPKPTEEHPEGPTLSKEHTEDSALSKECSQDLDPLEERCKGLTPSESHLEGPTQSKENLECMIPSEKCLEGPALSEEQSKGLTLSGELPQGPASTEEQSGRQTSSAKLPQGLTPTQQLPQGPTLSEEHPQGLSDQLLQGLITTEKCPHGPTSIEKLPQCPSSSVEQSEGLIESEECPEGLTTSKQPKTEIKEHPPMDEEKIKAILAAIQQHKQAKGRKVPMGFTADVRFSDRDDLRSEQDTGEFVTLDEVSDDTKDTAKNKQSSNSSKQQLRRRGQTRSNDKTSPKKSDRASECSRSPSASQRKQNDSCTTTTSDKPWSPECRSHRGRDKSQSPERRSHRSRDVFRSPEGRPYRDRDCSPTTERRSLRGKGKSRSPDCRSHHGRGKSPTSEHRSYPGTVESPSHKSSSIKCYSKPGEEKSSSIESKERYQNTESRSEQAESSNSSLAAPSAVGLMVSAENTAAEPEKETPVEAPKEEETSVTLSPKSEEKQEEMENYQILDLFEEDIEEENQLPGPEEDQSLHGLSFQVLDSIDDEGTAEREESDQPQTDTSFQMLDSVTEDQSAIDHVTEVVNDETKVSNIGKRGRKSKVLAANKDFTNQEFFEVIDSVQNSTETEDPELTSQAPKGVTPEAELEPIKEEEVYQVIDSVDEQSAPITKKKQGCRGRPTRRSARGRTSKANEDESQTKSEGTKPNSITDEVPCLVLDSAGPQTIQETQKVGRRSTRGKKEEKITSQTASNKEEPKYQVIDSVVSNSKTSEQETQSPKRSNRASEQSHSPSASLWTQRDSCTTTTRDKSWSPEHRSHCGRDKSQSPERRTHRSRDVSQSSEGRPYRDRDCSQTAEQRSPCGKDTSQSPDRRSHRGRGKSQTTEHRSYPGKVESPRNKCKEKSLSTKHYSEHGEEESSNIESKERYQNTGSRSGQGKSSNSSLAALSAVGLMVTAENTAAEPEKETPVEAPKEEETSVTLSPKSEEKQEEMENYQILDLFEEDIEEENQLPGPEEVQSLDGLSFQVLDSIDDEGTAEREESDQPQTDTSFQMLDSVTEDQLATDPVTEMAVADITDQGIFEVIDSVKNSTETEDPELTSQAPKGVTPETEIEPIKEEEVYQVIDSVDEQSAPIAKKKQGRRGRPTRRSVRGRTSEGESEEKQGETPTKSEVTKPNSITNKEGADEVPCLVLDSPGSETIKESQKVGRRSTRGKKEEKVTSQTASSKEELKYQVIDSVVSNCKTSEQESKSPKKSDRASEQRHSPSASLRTQRDSCTTTTRDKSWSPERRSHRSRDKSQSPERRTHRSRDVSRSSEGRPYRDRDFSPTIERRSPRGNKSRSPDRRSLRGRGKSQTTEHRSYPGKEKSLSTKHYSEHGEEESSNIESKERHQNTDSRSEQAESSNSSLAALSAENTAAEPEKETPVEAPKEEETSVTLSPKSEEKQEEMENYQILDLFEEDIEEENPLPGPEEDQSLDGLSFQVLDSIDDEGTAEREESDQPQTDTSFQVPDSATEDQSATDPVTEVVNNETKVSNIGKRGRKSKVLAANKDFTNQEFFEVIDSVQNPTETEDPELTSQAPKDVTPEAELQPIEEEEVYQVIDSVDEQSGSHAKKKQGRRGRPTRRSVRGRTSEGESEEKQGETQTKSEATKPVSDSAGSETIQETQKIGRRSTRGNEEKITSLTASSKEEPKYQVRDLVEDDKTPEEAITVTRSSRGRRGLPTKRDILTRGPAAAKEYEVCKEMSPKVKETLVSVEEVAYKVIDSVENEGAPNAPPVSGWKRKRGRPRNVKATSKPAASKKTKVAIEEEPTYQIIDSVEEAAEDQEILDDPETAEESLTPEDDYSKKKITESVCEEDEEEPVYQIVDSVEDDQGQEETEDDPVPDNKIPGTIKSSTEGKEEQKDYTNLTEDKNHEFSTMGSAHVILNKEAKELEMNNEEPGCHSSRIEECRSKEMEMTAFEPKDLLTLDEVSADEAPEEGEEDGPERKEGGHQEELKNQSNSIAHRWKMEMDITAVEAHELLTLDEVGADEGEEDDSEINKEGVQEELGSQNISKEMTMTAFKAQELLTLDEVSADEAPDECEEDGPERKEKVDQWEPRSQSSSRDARRRKEMKMTMDIQELLTLDEVGADDALDEREADGSERKEELRQEADLRRRSNRERQRRKEVEMDQIDTQELLTLDEVGADDTPEQPEAEGPEPKEELSIHDKGKDRPISESDQSLDPLKSESLAAVDGEKDDDRRHDDDITEESDFIMLDEAAYDKEEVDPRPNPVTSGRKEGKEDGDDKTQSIESQSDEPASSSTQQISTTEAEASDQSDKGATASLGGGGSEVKVVGKRRKEMMEPEAKRSRSRSPDVPADFKLPTYNPDNPLGQEFVVPKAGFFCNICSIFYINKNTAKEVHCRSRRHYDNLEKHYLKLTATPSRASSPTSSNVSSDGV